MTLPQLRNRSRFWCQLLGIPDKVTVRWAKKAELPDSFACLYPHTHHGVADIAVTKEQPYLEFWLVHELLHIVLLNSNLRSTPEKAEERAINQTARALCVLAGIECPSSEYIITNGFI